MKELLGFFFFLGGQVTFVPPDMPICVQKIILKARYLQTHVLCIFTKMLRMNHSSFFSLFSLKLVFRPTVAAPNVCNLSCPRVRKVQAGVW